MSLPVGEDRVELALRLVEHAQGLVALLRGAVEAYLAQGVHDADRRVAEVLGLRHGVVAELGPRRVLRRRGGLLAARIGQREALAAAGGLGLDEAFVLQQLQGRVDRAGARAPDAAGAALQLLDHLVAVHGPFEQQRQQGRSHVGPAAAAAAALAASAWPAGAEAAESGTAEARAALAERESGREAEAAHEALAQAAGVTVALVHVVVSHDLLRSVVDS